MKYYVHFQYKNKEYSADVDRDEWDRIWEEKHIKFRIKDYLSDNQVIEIEECK